ncbi:AAA domain-containing protein [Candidatus Woesearchaeota archaeon]|nr:AAA domain-containing protein [Candidatus Woesearchaeota archaeon]
MVKLGLVNVDNNGIDEASGFHKDTLYYFHPELQERLSGSVPGLQMNGGMRNLSELVQEQVVKMNDNGVAAYIRTQPIFDFNFFDWRTWWKFAKSKLKLLPLEEALESDEEIDSRIFDDLNISIKPYYHKGKLGYEIAVNVANDKVTDIFGRAKKEEERAKRWGFKRSKDEAAVMAVASESVLPEKANAPKYGASLDREGYRTGRIIDFLKKMEKLYAALAKKKSMRLPDETMLLAPQNARRVFLNDKSEDLYNHQNISITDNALVDARPVIDLELKYGRRIGNERNWEDLLAEIRKKKQNKKTKPVGNRPGKGKTKTFNPNETKDKSLDFKNYKTVKKILDKFVIGQSSATLTLAEAICDHYQRMQMSDEDRRVARKKNILLVGPTGSGKTYLARTIADKVLNVPFAEVSMQDKTASGYVGGDVVSILEELISNAGEDISAAEKGIVYLDEIDKIRKQGNGDKRDIKGDDIQNELLTVLAGEVKETKYGPIDTSNILFVCGGAFEGIENYCKLDQKLDKKKNRRRRINADVLRAYGFKGEFIGRLPYVVELNKLNKKDYVRILKAPGSALDGEKKLFERYGIRLEFEKDAIERLAEYAAEDSTGARAIEGLLADSLKGLRTKDHRYISNGTLRMTRKRVDEQLAKYR